MPADRSNSNGPASVRAPVPIVSTVEIRIGAADRLAQRADRLRGSPVAARGEHEGAVEVLRRAADRSADGGCYRRNAHVGVAGDADHFGARVASPRLIGKRVGRRPRPSQTSAGR